MKQQEELTFKEKVIDFMNNHWKTVVVIIGTAVIIMAGILILDSMNKGKGSDSAEMAEDIQEAYSDWASESPENRDDTALLELIDKALVEFPRHFAAQRALFTKGLMAIENQEWEAAYSVFEDIAKKWPESYLASVSLFNAGSAREEAGDIDGAIADWQMVADEYATTSADAPEALFNIGRVEEGRGNSEAALETYRSLESAHPNSRWTDIAKSRILILESR